MSHWTLEQIPWSSFDRTKIDPDLVKVVKAAAMVEYNGGDYAAYLCNIFADDAEFCRVVKGWSVEEVQHGAALARWAELADPEFDFQSCFDRFTDGFKLPLGTTTSARGSRAGELVARCIVETGTSSYYTALMEASAEPVLKEICRNIAADELRHYKLFYSHLRRYLERDGINAWQRVKIALSRITESEDDELAYAYYAANHPTEAYERRRFTRAYARRAYRYYQRRHVERAMAMILKATGLKPTGRLNRMLTGLGYRFLTYRARRLTAMNA